MPKEKVTTRKPGDPGAGEEFVTVKGKRRRVPKESLVSLVRGAIRSRSPNLKDRRQRLSDAVDEAVSGASKPKRK